MIEEGKVEEVIVAAVNVAPLEKAVEAIGSAAEAVTIVAKAVCRAYGPCVCKTPGKEDWCHAGVIYRREGEAAVHALIKAGRLK